MNALRAIFLAKMRIARHTAASIRNESKLKVSVVSVAAVLLWVGAYALFYGGFSWIDRQYSDTLGIGASFSIAQIIMTRLLSVLAVALFFMLTFSNILIVFATLYRSREVAYLLQSPMTYQAYFLARFAECVSISSWATAYLGSPLILAYGWVNGAPLTYFVAAMVVYVPFVTIPAALGAIITMAIIRVFPRLPTGSLIAVAAGGIIALFLYARRSLTADRLADDPFIDRLLDAATQTQSHYLPSFWASQGVLSAGAGAYGEAVYYWMLLTSNALFFTWLASGIAQRIFYPGWSYLMGQDRQRIRPMNRGVLGRFAALTRALPHPAQALTAKDVRLFWRDPVQWSQFVIFFGLMALYIANLRSDSVAMQSEVWRGIIVSLNIAASTLILATLTSRFVFPLVSLEGRRFWILGLAPLTLKQLVWQKFWLSVATCLAFTLGLVILSCVKLQVDNVSFFVSVYSVVVTNFALSGLAIGLGSLYPNFQEDNPARIVSGMGGTLNFLLSMAYIVLIIGAQGVILQWRFVGAYASEQSFYYALAGVLAFVTVVSALTWLVPMRLGLRNLNRMEF